MQATDQVARSLFSIVHRIKTGVHDPIERGALPVLLILRGGPMRPSEVASHLGLDLSTVSRHVAGLDKAGLVVRSPDPDDGRAQLLQLTESGERALADAMGRRRDLLLEVMADWPADDRQQLADLLTRLDTGLTAAAPGPHHPFAHHLDDKHDTTPQGASA